MKQLIVLGVLSAALLVLLPATALAQTPPTPAEWDQERVTALAEELSKDLDSLYTVIYKALPDTSMTFSQTGRRHQLKDEVRLIRSEARHLHARLMKGDGRAKTHSIYMRINELRRDAAENARQLFLTNDVITAIDEARDVWARLHPYYMTN